MRTLRVAAAIFALSMTAVGFAADIVAADRFPAVEWRLLGPFRGGWSTMAVGVPTRPETFYFGAAGGGMWKSDDAGATWHPSSDGLTTPAIGAIAVAPSAPDTLYVGTGQPEPRYDIGAGDGVYKSVDGGAHWQHVGLDMSRHVGAILVDPGDADTVLVGALGPIFGAGGQRGVFRTTDGGRTWTRTLFVDDHTGVVDLARDPQRPETIYAAAWTAINYPWLSYFTPIEGKGSAIYRSLDDGKTWKRLAGVGWPGGELGRIGLAVTHLSSGASRVYASIDSEKHGGLYRSDDGGDHWQRVNDASAVATWYVSRLTVAPDDPDTLYTVGQSVHRSTDAGRTFTIVKGAPGGDDYHYLWINPEHPDYRVTASDQGTVVTVDGGRHWSDWYNQPTGQFYHLAADDRFPYWVYSGQQDSGTVGIASRSNYGAISFRDWHPVGGDERDYDLPDPENPEVVYGSGLGGRISRWDAHTGMVQNVSPWPVTSYGARPTDVKYRYTWISPIAFSRRAPYALYAGAQVLFRTTDGGSHWQTISPDLTGKRAETKDCDGEVPVSRATACGFGVIYSIAPSPRNNDEIWIGTDNGRVQLTRDGGRSWSNVTPKTIPAWSRIDSIDLSALEPGVAYAAVDNHRQNDFRPMALRTKDYGKTWTSIANGLPDGHFVTVVRADPERRGLLYAGTDTGVYVSFDDGDHWQSLQRNLPVAWVRDLLVHHGDLIVATQGRAIWVLDDVSPLRQLDVGDDATRLFRPADVIRVRGSQNKDTPPPADTALGTNPPDGAIIDYQLRDAATRVVIDIRDAEGNLVRHFDNAEPDPVPRAERYFAEAWTQPMPLPGTGAGAHRFIWDLRYACPKAIKYGYSIGAVLGRDTPMAPQGALVVPGRYEVVLSVDGQSYRQPLDVVADPRVKVDAATMEQTLAFHREVSAELERVWRIHGEVEAVHAQLGKLEGGNALSGNASLRRAIAGFDDELKPVLSGKGETAPNLGAIGDALSALATDVAGSDRPPTEPQHQVLADYRSRLDAAAALWRRLQDAELPALDARLGKAGLPTLHVPAVDEISLGDDSESKDLP